VSELLVDPFSLPFMARALIELCILGVLGGVVSAFVLLRKLAFAADTLTHTVFPGVVIGFVVAGEGGIFVGALIAGVLTAVALTVLTAVRRVSSDAALAVLLTAMFSIGVVVVSRQTEYTSDLTTFLFGHVLTVSAQQLVETGVVAAIVVLVLAFIGKELVFRAFDGEGARAAGYRVGVLDLLLNVMVALVVVAAVQAVGTILVIALLIVPAATARLISDRLSLVVAIGCVVGILGGYVGLVASYGASVFGGVRLSSGATVVLALVVAYVLALVYAGVRRVVTR
jgi:manganese/iron transport system permease protein